MATEQTNITEAVAQAMAETAREVVQAMAVARTENCTGHEGTQNAGPKIGGTVMKQQTVNWKAEDKYNDLKNFRFEVNNVFKLYNIPWTEKMAIIKKLARQERPTILRNINPDRTRKM